MTSSPIVRSWYAARFSRDGTYRGATELRLSSFSPQRIAVFESGDLLLLGTDEVNRQVKAMRYSPTGGAIFFYATAEAFTRANDSLPSPFGKDTAPDSEKLAVAALNSSAQFTQVTHRKEAIVLLQRNAGTNPVEFYSNGTMRTLKLPVVEAFRADSVVPSDDSLIIRYRRTKTNAGTGQDGFVAQVDPVSGHMLRRMNTGEATIWDVTCARKEDFRVVRLKSDYDFQFFHASAIPVHE